VWSVIATILFAVCAILAIVSYVNGNNERKQLEALRARYASVVAESEISKFAGIAQRSGNRAWLDVAVSEANQLSQLMTGQADATPAIAQEAMAGALASAQTAAGETVSVPADNLVAAFGALSAQIDTLQAELEKATKDLADARATITTNIEAQNQLLAAKEKEVAEADLRTKLASDDSAAQLKSQNDIFKMSADEVKEQLLLLTEQNNTLNGQIASLQREITGVRRERDAAIAKVTGIRGRTDQVATAIDGRVVRATGDRVFIDLGSGQQVTPGLTFEVYSSLGIPSVGPEASQDVQLEGKASIQVIRVQPGSSECKVIRLSPGQVVNEGDLIANLAYDKNLAYNFYVFGKYNLDNKGEATERDTDVIKRLITQFGSKVGDQISTATDFVVIGAEPVVPTFTQQEMDEDPLKAYQMAEAIKALDEFNAVRAQAIQLNIPLLNQNRFLYLVGYFSESQR